MDIQDRPFFPGEKILQDMMQQIVDENPGASQAECVELFMEAVENHPARDGLRRIALHMALADGFKTRRH
jgi:hypothetical protein